MGGVLSRTFIVKLGGDDSVAAVLAFHQKHLTEHLWPRTKEEFEALARDNALYLAFETGAHQDRLVGLCYIKPGQESTRAERHEFGGVYVTESCRGIGVASVLGKIAILNQFAFDPPKGRLIAHVHEGNDLPRRMLEDQLGFFRNGEEIPPAGIAPPSLKRNDKGEVVGHLYEFRRKALLGHADWLEKFNGRVAGKVGASVVRVELALVTRYMADALTAVRAAARQR